MKCIQLYVTKLICCVITDKDTGKCKYYCIMHLWSDRQKTGNMYVYLWQGSWCPSYLSLLIGHVLVISNMIRYNVQMWYPICLIYNLVACWAFLEIQGHLPHFQDQYMKFWFLHFQHFHRMFGDNFLTPFKLDGMMNHHTCTCICCLTGLAIFSKH